ncbi:uncharacterized protein LOC135837953 [Planococcus citri]|uniref:uncharacterized protein LOC135837953 n=1 Tax=Planococcus citri TaxID=170843 RepID=UPI0031F85B64
MTDSPTDLQSLAAKYVCIQLLHEWAEGETPVIDVWRKGNGYHTCSDHDWFVWQLYEMQVPRFATIIPNKIRYQIEDNMALIVEQVMIWIQYHHEVNFFHDQPSTPTSSLSEYVVKLVWNHHFNIDYAATAKNILTNEKLSPLERFRFASTYCIVEEIEKFRDLMADANLVLPEWDFIKDPFMVYWSKYLRNELDTISVPGVSDKFSVDTLMFVKTVEEFDLWPPVEHFFDKVDWKMKAVKFEHIVERYGKNYLKELLAKLTVEEWMNAASFFAISKMVEKIVGYGTLDGVRFIWQLYQSKMKSKDFRGILETLVPLSTRNPSNFEKWTPLLMEIWTSAGSELKESAIDIKLWQSIGENCIYQIPLGDTKAFRARRQISDPMKFIKLVLKSMEAKKRTEFFEKNFNSLIIWVPFAELDKLMREFLERFDRDVVQLKKQIAKCSEDEGEINQSLYILLAFGDFDAFDAVVSFYFPAVEGFLAAADEDEERLTYYKWMFLVPMTGLKALSMSLYFADWRTVYEYVKKTTVKVKIAPDAFMITLIEAGWFQDIRHLDEKLNKGEMRDLKDCLTTALPANDSRFEFLKKRFKFHMFTNLFATKHPAERVFNRANVQDFLLWIYNGDEKLVDKNFKQQVLFPNGFLVQFKSCFRECFQATKSMEEFLMWCFESEAERSQFKREMIYKYREYKMIEDLLTRRRYRRAMLFWFFDGDLSAIEKFTVECSRNPIYEDDTDAAAEANPDANAEAGPGAAAEANPDAVAEAGPDANADADLDANAEPEAGPDARADAAELIQELRQMFNI